MEEPKNPYGEPANPYEELSHPFEEHAKPCKNPRQSKARLAFRCVRVVFWVGVVLCVLVVSLKARDIRQNIFYAIFDTAPQKTHAYSRPQQIMPHAWQQQAKERARIREASPKSQN